LVATGEGMSELGGALEVVAVDALGLETWVE
jgi:hypothetical protein